MKKIKIQSIGDLITNSSTEVFTIIDENTINTIKNVVSIIAGEEVVNRFEFKLDYCECIENRVDEIIEYLLDNDIEFVEDPDETDNEKAKRIIASCIDLDIIEYHYNLIGAGGVAKVFMYEGYGEGKFKKTDEVTPYNEEVCSFLKDNIVNILDMCNDSHEWQEYPSIVVIPKDKHNKKDVEIANTIARLPFLCNHEATYC